MKRRLPFVLLLAFLAVPSAASGDGCPPTTCGTTSAAVPGSRLLAVRPNGQTGPLVVHDLVSQKRLFALPRGLVSADGRVFFSSRTRASRTTVTRYLVQTGRAAGARRLPGRYVVAGVSRSGATLVLSTAGARSPSTVFVVLDWRTRRVLERVRLRGSYGLEAISPSSRRLFLVRYRSNSYELQVLDLVTRRLRATPLASDEPGEKMTGNPWTAIASRDGRWLLTVYLKGAGTAFVHALDLRTGVGHCIDLPAVGADSLALGTSALALSPDERRLYVASPLAGRLFVIDLARAEVARTVRFRPLSARAYVHGINPSGAVSSNGRMLTFSGGGLLWAYDIAYGTVRGPYRVGSSRGRDVIRGYVTGLAYGPRGRSVVALRVDGRYVVLDASSGRRVS